MRRSRLEIYMDILKAMNRGVKKPTRIMYLSNISWVPLSNILKFLVEQGVVTVKSEGRREEYFLTEKGREILNVYKKLQSLLMEKIESPPP